MNNEQEYETYLMFMDDNTQMIFETLYDQIMPLFENVPNDFRAGHPLSFQNQIGEAAAQIAVKLGFSREEGYRPGEEL